MSEDSNPASATAEQSAPAFLPEEMVEVTSMEPCFVGSWFEGHVVRVGKLKKRLTVEYDHLLDDADESRPLREVVDASSVRPRRPPPAAPEEFCTGDAVEAFMNDGWWVGDIVETLPKSVFIVVFPDGDVQRISRENLRKRLDWVRGEWVSPVKKMDVVRETTPNRKHGIVREISPKRKHRAKRKRGKPPANSNKLGDKRSPVKGGKKIEGNFSAEPILQRCEEREANAADSECKIKDAPRLDDVTISKIVHSQGSVNRITEEGKDNFGSSSNCSPQVAFKADGEVESTNPTVTSLHAGSGEALAEDKTKTFSESGGVQADLELAITEVSPPLTYCSFAKMIPVWELVLSLDVFRKMPQYPHFQPLEQFSEESREGLALGQLVNFANLVDSIDTVKFDTPTCDLEKKLEVLGSFEQHGFDVQVLRLCLQEWIKAKKKCDKFKQELFEHEKQISEKEKQSSMIDTKIDYIDKKARDLSTERAAFVRTKETCQFELSQLQKNAQVLKEGYADAKRGFDNIVAGGNF